MLVGVPKEIKVHEYRVGLTPASVRELVHHGHRVLLQSGAGAGIGAADADYRSAGADIAADATEVFARAEMIVKVKEPQAAERAMLRAGQVLFTYLHLAPDPEQCRELLASGATCIAYETVTSPGGGLPLLAPMSEVAGRLAVQAGAYCLERAHGGMLRRIDRLLGARVMTVFSNHENVEREVLAADLVIGAVLIAGAAAPRLLTRDMLPRMKPGAVIVDVAIDQGGCAESSRPTTHADPTFVVDGVLHYCVANMPGGVPRTSTYALNHATLPFVLALADKGWQQALRDDPHLRAGLNICAGHVTCAEVAEALGYEALASERLL
jgi:alanine dehydrogenase